MTSYINLTSLRYPVSRYDLAQETPDVSWADAPDDDALAQHGYARVVSVPPRALAPGETTVADGAGQDGDGQWVTLWRYELAPPEALLAAARADKVTAIDAERDRRLALGALHGGKRFSMSDTSRTDLGGMATTAGLVVMGLLSWPDSYAQGWIALDNTRLPLSTPQDGITLAAKVGLTYSEIVQHARTLKDAALAGDPAAVDPLAGWPD